MEQRPGGGSAGNPNNGGFSERGRALGGEVQEQLEVLRARLGDVNERVVGFIKERPVTAILIAVGAGFLIGRMLRS